MTDRFARILGTTRGLGAARSLPAVTPESFAELVRRALERVDFSPGRGPQDTKDTWQLLQRYSEALDPKSQQLRFAMQVALHHYGDVRAYCDLLLAGSPSSALHQHAQVALIDFGLNASRVTELGRKRVTVEATDTAQHTQQMVEVAERLLTRPRPWEYQAVLERCVAAVIERQGAHEAGTDGDDVAQRFAAVYIARLRAVRSSGPAPQNWHEAYELRRRNAHCSAGERQLLDAVTP